MKKKHIGLICLALATACGIGGVVYGVVINQNKNTSVEAASQTIQEFPSCENWYNSGKGFALDFTFDIPTTAKTNEFSLYDSGWNRLSRYAYLNFDTSGNVTVSGNVNSGMYVIRHADYWTFVCMYNQYMVYTAKGATGTETASILQMESKSEVPLNIIRCQQIDCNIFVNEDAYIKDDWYEDINGLMFKAFTPTYNSSSKYGIAIVPNEYLANNTSGYLEDFDSKGINYAMSYCVPQQLSSSSPLYAKYGAGYTFQATLKVKEANYMRDFSAIAFEELSSGTKKYAFNITEEKANLYNTAYKEIKNGGLSSKASTYASGIVSNIDTRSASLSSTHLNAYPANNIDQIMKNANYSSVDTSIAMKAAKGESESAQLVLRSSSSTELSYFAGVSNLKNGNNVIENLNIEVSHELYQNVASNWAQTSSHYSYLNQLYPNGYDSLVTGYYPDALLPMHVAVRSGQNKINITNGANQALFIKVKVPANTIAGTYTGNIIIYVPNEGYITVPLSVNVLNFSLEGKRNQNTVLEISRSELEALYGETRAAFNNLSNPFYKSAWNMLADHGVCGGNVPFRLGQLSDLNDYVEAVKSYVNASKSKIYLIDFFSEEIEMKWTYRNSSSSTSVIDMTGDNKHAIILSDDYNSKAGLKTILEALVNASTDANNLLEGACIFDSGADEPGVAPKYLRSILNYNSIQRSIDYVETQCATKLASNPKVLKSLQDLVMIITCGPEDGTFAGTYSYANLVSISDVSGAASYCSCGSTSDITYTNLNAYCPNVMWNCDNSTHSGSGYSWAKLNEIYSGVDTTTRLWEYTCCQPVAPYPSYIINAPMIRSRANRWRQFSLGVQGEFYYMSNRTTQNESSITVLTESQIINGQATFEHAYGDGLFMYACHDLLSYADKDLYWLSSLRLENVSEASDDINYLYYAKELAGGTITAALSSIVDSVYTNKYQPYSMTTCANTLITARNNLITFIVGLVG